MELHLADLIAELAPPEEDARDGRFRVRPITLTPAHYVGRNAHGFPCILLKGSAGPLRAPIRLAAIEARFAVPCQIIPAEGQERHETLTVVVCTSPDPQSQSYFLHVCETIIRIVGPSPSLTQIVDAVQRLVDLFRRLARPASKSVIGLAGELYLISWSDNPATTVRSWRSADDERFDFAIEDVRLEVKASGNRVRAHSFSAEQCQPPPGTVGILASLFIEASGGGTSLMELIRTIEQKLAAQEELILKVQETVAETLGETLPGALTMRFDGNLARASLQFYDLGVIPAIRSGVPPEVTQLRFRSDLSRTPTIIAADLATRSAYLSALLPQFR